MTAISSANSQAFIAQTQLNNTEVTKPTSALDQPVVSDLNKNELKKDGLPTSTEGVAPAAPTEVALPSVATLPASAVKA